MHKHLLAIFVLIIIIFGLVPGVSEAALFPVDDGKVYAHRGPDGVNTFFAAASSYHGPWKIFGGGWDIRINKVFSSQGTPYYFVNAGLEDNKVLKKPLTAVILTINGNNFSLQPIAGAQKTIDGNNFRGYYSLPEEAVQLLENADKIKITFQFDGASPETGSASAKAIAGFKKLLTMEKTRYVRDGRVLDLSEVPKNESYYPQLFIPDAKPEDVLAALIYKTEFITNSKGNDELNYSWAYTVSYTPDPEVVQLESRQAFSYQYDCATIACRPYKNGVWVTMSMMCKEYFPHDSPGYGYNDGGPGFWQTISEIWAQKLEETYHDLYGTLDYGFTLVTGKDVKHGPFKVKDVNAAKFPELANIKPGDVLTAINDTPTVQMQQLDVEYWLIGNPTPLTFTFRTADGDEKKIAITPHIVPVASEARRDYKKALGQIPKQFINKITLPSDIVFVDDIVYDPLGTGK